MSRLNVQLSGLSLIITVLFLLAAPLGSAPLPPAEQLLPADTVAVVSLPDWDQFSIAFAQSAYGQLWADPVIKPLKEKFLAKFQTEILTSFQSQLGIKLADYKDIFHGQITLALTPPPEKANRDFSYSVLLDSKDKKDLLKSRLDDLRKKWVESGRKIRLEKIRDIDFTAVVINSDELDKVLEQSIPEPDKTPAKKLAQPKKAENYELLIGQSDSLLIIGNDNKAIERILIRQAGGLVSPLAEESTFQNPHGSLPRGAAAFAWVNFKPIYDLLGRTPTNPPAQKTSPLAGYKAEKLMAAIGLTGLKSIGLKLTTGPEGPLFELLVAIPEASRMGLIKVFAPEPKDASPPQFINGDTVKFHRWRLDGSAAWSNIERVLATISPEMSGLLQLGLATIGKEKDPNFDFRKSFVANLGNDLMSVQKAPRSPKMADLDSPPSLFLIGSPQPDELLRGFRAATALLPPPMSTTPLKERDFQGTKIYSFPLADDPDAPPPVALRSQRTFSFAAANGYVAMSEDTAFLEEFLRSGAASPKPLRDTPGLLEVTQKVGGMATGLFGFENENETTRLKLETLRNDPKAIEAMFIVPNLTTRINIKEQEKTIKEWFDISLVPPFDQISKYFYFSIFSGKSTPDGILLKLFFPTPPGLNKKG